MKVRLVIDGIFTRVEDVTRVLTKPEKGFYWIDANVEDLAILQPLFNLHELAVEDTMSEEDQRPKIEIYDNHYFIVVNSIRFDDEEIFLRPLNIFLGEYTVITVTKQKIHEMRTIKPVLLEEKVDRADVFLYHMIDIVVDNYFNVGDRIEMRIDKLEEDILVHTKKSQLEEIIGLRGEILWLRKMLGPQRQLIATLNNKELRLIDNELQKYFSDVYENQVKINDSFDTYRDLMGNLRDSYQSSLSARANDIMRIFTALTTIFMPLTFLTGVYGMNFVYLPFAESHWGAIIFIGIMVVLGLGMLYLFKKKDWL